MGKKKKNKKPRPVASALLMDGALTLPTPDGNGTVYYKYLAPTPEQIAHFARKSRAVGLINKLDAIYDLLEDILGEEDYAELMHRLRDRNDALEMSVLFPAIRGLVEEQTGFPTQSPSGSTSSENPTGRRSTGRVQPEGSSRANSTPSGTQPSSTSGSTNTSNQAKSNSSQPN